MIGPALGFLLLGLAALYAPTSGYVLDQPTSAALWGIGFGIFTRGLIDELVNSVADRPQD